MQKLENLITLAKNVSTEFLFDLIHYGKIIADEETGNGSGTTRYRIFEYQDRYFYNLMHNGNTEKCFEIAVDWKPFKNCTIFAYTPDDKHIYTIDTRNISRIDNIYKLPEALITENMECSYNGVKITYINDNTIAVNDKNIAVETDGSYTIKSLKNKIKANGGAKGLFRWLENISEYGKVESYPLFYQVFKQLAEKYI